MIRERIELVGGVEIAEDVRNRIKTVGVRGLDVGKANELGLFRRISNLLCASHASVMAAYRIYGQVDYLLSWFGGRKNEIAKAMGDFEKAFTKFINFWTSYYAHDDAAIEMNEETEALYHKVMRWAQLPEVWELGDKQRTDEPVNVAVKVRLADGSTLYFHKCVVESVTDGEPDESWCVTKYDIIKKTQTTVNTNMDKASAMMVAKRLSSEDSANIYTASIIRSVVERNTEVMPYKAYQANKTIGDIKNIEKTE